MKNEKAAMGTNEDKDQGRKAAVPLLSAPHFRTLWKGGKQCSMTGARTGVGHREVLRKAGL